MNIIQKNEKKINGKFEFFDRMIVNGYLLSLQSMPQFSYYLYKKGIKLVDFKPFAEEQTKSLCNHIDEYVKENDIELQWLSTSKISKQELVKKELERSEGKIGLIAAFSAVEPCKITTVVKNHEKKILEPAPRYAKCKHYYLYYNDEEFGLMYMKIQTWFPYNVQVYINGREYCSKVFDKNDIKYEMYNNSFSYIDDFEKAQKLADNLINQKISDSFDGIVKKINNLLPEIKEILGHSYYWCIGQCEFATDINFKSREDLETFYKKLVETSYFTFSSEDIYSFFGRKVNYISHFKKGEIISDLTHRYQGYRIKFKINKNQIKMYDKGNNLRIEVTINNPNDFKVMKEKEVIVEHQKLETVKEWKQMGKSTANLYRYAEISRNIINRYIEALPEIDLDEVRLSEVKDVSETIEIKNRRYTGFNLLNKETLTTLKVISNGKYLINGFSNKQIRKEIFDDSENKKIINKTTRLLAKLKAHGLIKKVARKNKYYLTTKGRKLCDSILVFTGRQLLS